MVLPSTILANRAVIRLPTRSCTLQQSPKQHGPNSCQGRDAAGSGGRVAIMQASKRTGADMDPQFWHERWARGEIGFHRGDVHPLLVRHGAPLAGRRVLVPLCGKSLDLVHLAELGCHVVGIELSAAAIGAFFEEQRLEPAVTAQGPGRVWQAGPYTLLEGNYFAFSAADLGPPCTGLYDRAALIALPPERRPAYAAHTARLLVPEAWGLLITLDYPQEAMAGPPFAVPDTEVRALYGPRAEIAELEIEDALASEPRFAERGLTRLRQTAWALAFRGT